MMSCPQSTQKPKLSAWLRIISRVSASQFLFSSDLFQRNHVGSCNCMYIPSNQINKNWGSSLRYETFNASDYS